MAIIRRKQLTDTSFIKLAFSIYLAFKFYAYGVVIFLNI